MPQYTITPWRNFSELIQVKNDLFSLDTDATNPEPTFTISTPTPTPTTDSTSPTPNDRKQHAVNLIAAWSMRGKIPHAVQSTSLLIEAQLHHAAPGASAFSVRATYAAAFCRFITGYCDLGQLSGTTSSRNMHDVAHDLDMPASWVDLRHDATHGKLPAVARLETASAAALVWLWANYWAGLQRAATAPTPSSHASGKKKQQQQQPAADVDALRRVLSVFVRARTGEVKQGVDVAEALGTSRKGATAKACLEILERCRGYEVNLRNLVFGMVEVRMMVPEGRGPKDSLEGAFLIWTPLILTLHKYQTLFVPLLLKRLVSILAEPAYLHVPPDAFREALYAWTLHIVAITKPGKSAKGGDADGDKMRSVVVGECVMTLANKWTGPLAKRLVREGDETFRKRWEVFLAESWED